MVTTRSGKSTSPTQFDCVHDAASHMGRGFSHETRKQFAKFLNNHLFLLSGDRCESFTFRSASMTAVDSCEMRHYMPIYRSICSGRNTVSVSRFAEFERMLVELCPSVIGVVEDP